MGRVVCNKNQMAVCWHVFVRAILIHQDLLSCLNLWSIKGQLFSMTPKRILLLFRIHNALLWSFRKDLQDVTDFEVLHAWDPTYAQIDVLRRNGHQTSLSKTRFNSHAPQLAFCTTPRSSKVFYLKKLIFIGNAVRYSDYKKKLLVGGEA